MLKRQFMQGKENIKGKVIILTSRQVSSDRSNMFTCAVFFGKPVNVNQLDISASATARSDVYFQVNNAWSYVDGIMNTTSVTIQNHQNVTGVKINSSSFRGTYTVTLTDCEYA